MMRIGITGGEGFIGQHLRMYLLPQEKDGRVTVSLIPKSAFADPAALASLVAPCDALVHLAGKNRGDEQEIYDTNVSLARQLVAACASAEARPHILFASSTHAVRDTPYGRSKKEAGEILEAWAARSGGLVTLCILPHVFGEFSKPHHNSAVATLCYQISRGEASTIDPAAEVELVHARTVAARFMEVIERGETGTIRVAGRQMKLSSVYESLAEWGEIYRGGTMPRVAGRFEASLFMTLHSHLFGELFPRRLEQKADPRGMLYEIARHDGEGQVFFSTTVPGAVRGNHYHTHKFERFCVIEGAAEIRLRRLLTDTVLTYPVSGAEPVVIDMPSYYTHNLTNSGQRDMQAVFWISEQFDAADPDTYYEEV